MNSWTLGTSVGSQTLTATSPGLQGSPITFTATATATTTTTLQSNNDPAGEGEDVTFTATVDAVGSPSVPTGQVTFRNDGVSIGTGNLNGSVATLTVNNLPVGTHDISADYPATGNFGASSNVITQDIEEAVNGAPTAQHDPANPGDYTVDQDGQLVVSSTMGVLANDTDPDGDNLTAQLVPGPDVQNGTLTLNDDGSFTYTPDPGFSGMDTFEYEAFDGQDTSNVATVTITVNPL